MDPPLSCRDRIARYGVVACSLGADAVVQTNARLEDRLQLFTDELVRMRITYLLRAHS
jgi:hypothetical protein